MKHFQLLLLSATFFCTTVLFIQCTPSGKIPYDEVKAKVHFISLNQAERFTSNFRKGRVEMMRQLKDTNSFNTPLAEKFNRDAIAALLNQKGVTDVRIYLGQDDKGFIRLVLVGVDNKGNDITGGSNKIMRLTSNEESEPAIVIEAGQRCPTLCAIKSSLVKPN
ncbi:hypothetical protein ABIB62_002989 [Mucilaginibacter sp. UYP25]|uniref:hypothetical protein n=1 Tax=unclassified Mucilaginibacter TaxID=2617802 RepID=UPI003391372E